MKPYHIMLVDDNEDMLNIYLRVLSKEGFKVLTAATGNECLKQITTVRPEVFLLDVMLPDCNGIDLLREIKGRPEFANCIFILMSGFMVDNESKVHGLNAGAVDYLARPVPNNELVAKVKSLVNVLDFQESLVCLGKELDRRVTERTSELEISNHALRVSEDKLHSILDNAMDGFWLTDTAGRLLYVNETYCRMSGYNRQESQCLRAHDLECPVSVHDASLNIPRISEQGEERFESRHLRKDGSKFDVEVSAQYRPFEGGQLAIFLRDITERKQMEASIKQLNAELEARVSERTAALHQALEETKKVSFELVWAEERERERIVGELHDQVGQSLLLAKMKVDMLAAMATVEPLQQHATNAAALLEAVIRDVRSLTFRMRPPILDTAEIDITLKWLCSSITSDYGLPIDFANGCQPKSLSAEVRYSLYQAVREILVNAAKHAKAEKVHLSLSADDCTLAVQVKDNGVGFSFQDSCSIDKGISGYGLYNVQQRIEYLGGRFEIESAPGKGTAVTLMVPFSE